MIGKEDLWYKWEDKTKLQKEYHCLINESQSEPDLRKRLEGIRQIVLIEGTDGLGPPSENENGLTTFRGDLWKVLLGVIYHDQGALEEYENILKKERNKKRGTIIPDDIIRTFPENKVFNLEKQKRKMTRILHAFTWKADQNYTQGFNVLLAPFLICMNELDAFHCFHRLIDEKLSTYWMKPVAQKLPKNSPPVQHYLGVNAACKLADKILRIVDKKLHTALMENYAKTPGAMKPIEFWFHKQYTFRHMQTLSMWVKPLEDVIQLWDMILAMGIHMHILVYVAQLMGMRTKLMQPNTKINDLLAQSKWPKVNARFVSNLVVFYLEKVEHDKKLMHELENHTTDEELCYKLIASWVDDGSEKKQASKAVSMSNEPVEMKGPSTPLKDFDEGSLNELPDDDNEVLPPSNNQSDSSQSPKTFPKHLLIALLLVGAVILITALAFDFDFEADL
mmetsp:Transcript_22334/g.31260  ORF Transcript_22334/g.31260 Transcript_22334/m.31260 type:complete len:449 (-) Transcript_22334:407-1753(-)|eukprot:CAMPEP_0184492440 /NCGR_PEP_ID=MMETSP0113_2-20130426/23234_1 /TAXON_ID=91329 /ORGANISM="Norrisiella sphaerica, Strain BC52" /LENGTH=448 /DNA_ID=CAMNT_0026877237 /DNA_START=49 /DNA_END=1395 /DNA_ORIENTATION=+